MVEKVSVCLTLYNEGKGVLRVLNYLDRVEDLIDEVIIVSDACEDDTDSIIRGWCERFACFDKSFVIRNKRFGRADAIRKCLSLSRNDLNVIMAGDIQPFLVPDALRNLISYFDDSNVGGVTGHPTLLNGYRTVADFLSHLMWKSHDRVGKIQTVRGSFFHLNGEMFAVRKKCLDGFEDYNSLAEDAAMGLIIMRNGFKVLWAEDVSYFMKYPSSLSDWVKIRRRCCYGRVDLWKNYGLQDYPYYELSHPEYFVNILKSTHRSVRGVLSLVLGSFLEVLIRIYYSQTFYRKRDLLTDLWESAEDTKW